MIHGNLDYETFDHNASVQELFSKEAMGHTIGSNASIDKHKGTKKDFNIAFDVPDFSENTCSLTPSYFTQLISFICLIISVSVDKKRKRLLFFLYLLTGILSTAIL